MDASRVEHVNGYTSTGFTGILEGDGIGEDGAALEGVN